MKHIVKLIFGKEKGEDILDRMRAKNGSSDYRNSTPACVPS